MRYTPYKSFHMSIRNFSHILLDVNPKPDGSDEFCMLLQAACICQIGNWLRGSSNGDPIVIMAIYIDKDFHAHQHLLCQPDVSCTRVVFNWS
jgi:hypothetical protein